MRALHEETVARATLKDIQHGRSNATDSRIIYSLSK